MTDKYYPVTKEGLMKPTCPKCNTNMVVSGFTGNLFCPYHGEPTPRSTSRPDPLALLSIWRLHRYPTDDCDQAWNDETLFIKQLRENPEAVLKQGIADGWWVE